MDKPRKPIIGILGGIGSGKSTVAGAFGRLGCRVIDADKLSHKLLDKKKIKDRIVSCFGRDVVGRNGKIDRRKLAEAAFSSRKNAAKLNKIIHQDVLERTKQLINQYNQLKRVKVIVLDIPLLAEIGWDKKCDKLVFVDCSRPQRLKRARKMGIFNARQLKNRENFQFSLDRKIKIADNIIDNNTDYPSMRRQVKEIFTNIVESS